MAQSKVLYALRINHPILTSDKVTEMVGWTPSISWSVGDRRLSRDGQPLKGVRESTYWVYDFQGSTAYSSGASFRRISRQLLKRRQAICDLVSTEGKIELLIGIFVSKSCGLTLETEVMEALASMSIKVAFDIYG